MHRKCTENIPDFLLVRYLQVSFSSVYSCFLSHFLTLRLTARNVVVQFFCHFGKKNARKKRNYLCSSLLKMFFHKRLPLLIPNCKIWSHCIKIFVSSISSNHFFGPTVFSAMHHKSPSCCMCRNDVAYLKCDGVESTRKNLQISKIFTTFASSKIWTSESFFTYVTS